MAGNALIKPTISEILELVDFCNKTKADRSRNATPRDFSPKVGAFNTGPINNVTVPGFVPASTPFTIFQWTVDDGNEPFLMTYIGVTGYANNAAGNVFDAPDEGGQATIQINSNGVSKAGPFSFAAFANQPCLFLFQPKEVVALICVLGNSASHFTMNIVTSIRGYMVNPEIASRIRPVTILNAGASVAPSGTTTSAAVGKVF
jgi:hypothetical protein